MAFRIKINSNWKVHIIDLVVVIIGITIAFSLNNWNEGRKDKVLEKQYLRSFLSDLASDTAEFQRVRNFDERYLRLTKKMLSILERKDYENDSITGILLNLYNFTAYTPSENTFQTLRGSGRLEIISNFDLMNEINRYYSHDYGNVRSIDGLLKSGILEGLGSFVKSNVRVVSNPGVVNSAFLSGPEFENLLWGISVQIQGKMLAYEAARKNATQLMETINSQLQ